MRALLFVGVSASLLAGCGAQALNGGEPRRIDFAVRDTAAPVVGEPQVLATQINPMQPLTARAAGDTIAFTYARRGQQGNELRVDAGSLHPQSSTELVYASKPSVKPDGEVRIELANGSSVVLWTAGSVEWGRRAMARSFGPDGKPRSAPLILSTQAMDVLGAPSGATVDGHRVVATFSAIEGQAFELVAVPIGGL